MKAESIPAETAKQVLGKLPLANLIEAFEVTNSANGAEVPTVRGWIMDELEARNPVAFDAWLMTTEASPRRFFEATTTH